LEGNRDASTIGEILEPARGCVRHFLIKREFASIPAVVVPMQPDDTGCGGNTNFQSSLFGHWWRKAGGGAAS